MSVVNSAGGTLLNGLLGFIIKQHLDYAVTVTYVTLGGFADVYTSIGKPC